MNELPDTDTVEPIAIVGMACRFPGAPDVDTFWRNLRDGVESIQFFSETTLQAAGVAPELYRQPGYVAAHGKVEGVDCFDAEFFGFSPREAELMDPQHRLFLECAWSAIEHAGHNPETVGERFGVIAGVGLNTYLINNLLARSDLARPANFYSLFIANDKDFLPTRVSYKLNLTGPSFGVNTACSSSLVAVHLACQQLWTWQCNAVLAGGVALQTPQDSGYLYQPGGITSADGHCRAFDVAAGGTVSGSGVGVVVLKRLADALSDGDTIHALIRGTACNNDGSRKVGYTAPGVDGQAAVIAEALSMAGVAAESIGYLEAHGTGTALGDPIEIAALTQAFASERQQFCRIGSVKTNIGHLDTAAGIAGLIKTVLALRHQAIPPSLNYTAANPKIDFPATPFRVNSQLTPWLRGSQVRRAAVSAFGIGGTNAHVVLEEAPAEVPRKLPSGPQLCVLSARSPTARHRQTAQLAEYLDINTDAPLADVAWTLCAGRRHFGDAAFVIADTPRELAGALRSPALNSGQRPALAPRIAFLFPGQGAQQAGAGRQLYRDEPAFRDALDDCAVALLAAGAVDVRPLLLCEASPEATEAVQRTENAQPVLFALSIALATLWRHRGVAPAAVLGHSSGEYAGAVCAGILTLEDAARALAARARLMSQLPPGAMAAVGLSREKLQARLGLSANAIAIAAVNGPDLCTVAGDSAAIDALGTDLTAQGVFYRRLQTAHAFHSPAVVPVLNDFRTALTGLSFSAPRIPFYSAVLGRQASVAEITDKELWVGQIRSPVLFGPAADILLADGFTALLEVGPGNTLSSMVRRSSFGNQRQPVTVPGLAAGADEARDQLNALGQLWLAGVNPRWESLFASRPGRRPLPTYPFERSCHWVEPQLPVLPRSLLADVDRVQKPVDSWFYLPTWKRAVPLLPGKSDGRWLLFLNGCPLSAALLPALGTGTLQVHSGENFATAPLTVNPTREADFDALLSHLAINDLLPDRIVFAWGLHEDPLAAFHALLRLTRTLGRHAQRPLELILLSRGLAVVHDGEAIDPLQACLMSTMRVIPEELPGLCCRGIDLPVGDIDVDSLIRELLAVPAAAALVALRGRHRWLSGFEPLTLPAPATPVFRQGGAYLITGGLGGMGLLLAAHLARSVGARLVLTSRRPVPPPEDWQRLAQCGLIRQPLADLERFLIEREGAIDSELAIRCVEDRPGLREKANRMAAALAIDYLKQHDLDLRAGQRLPSATLYATCQVLPEFHRLLRHLLNMLIEDGWLRSEGDELCALRDFSSAPSTRDLLEALCRDFPTLAAQFEMVANCVAQYPDALSGRVPAIGVLYPDGQRYIITEAAERSEEHGNFRVYRTLLADLLQQLARQAGSGRPLRILEIGGGNAIMTGLVIERLRDLNVEYHFTDLGRSFVQAAADKAQALGYDFMKFASFDVTRDPVAQGFALGSFDAVIGLDVVHATPSIRETVTNLRQLLVPGGLLGLVESARTERWNDMVWGLAEGWWYAQDIELRNPNSPLLSTVRWEKALADSGFSSLLALPIDQARRARTDCSLILAQNGAPDDAALVELAEHCLDHVTLNALLDIRRYAADLLVCTADVADAAKMEMVVSEAEARFGPLCGVIHAAAVEDKALIANRHEPFAEAELRPKLTGAQVLDQVFRQRPLDFMVLCSSITGTVGGGGQVGYCAANAFLDAFAEQRSQQRNELTVSIAWGRWQGVGLARHFESWHASRTGIVLEGGMSADDGVAALERILHHRIAPRVAVMTTEWCDDQPASPVPAALPDRLVVPELPIPAAGEFIGSRLEQQLASIWRQILGTQRFDRDTPFQQLGGDSLIGIQLISRIKEQLGIQLPIHSIFDSPTIAAQAQRVADMMPAMEEGEL